MNIKITSMLSILLIVMLAFTSCKSTGVNADYTDGTAVSDKEDIPTDKADAAGDKAGDAKNNGSVSETGVSADESDNEKESDSSQKAQDSSTAVTTTSDPANTNNDDESHPKKGVMTFPEYVYISPEELQTRAELIFVGQYTGQSFQTIPKESIVGEDFQYENLYTNFVFKPINVTKGTATDQLLICCQGGTVGDTSYSNQSNPKFKEGKKYFMYLEECELLSTDDKTSYRIITTNCFEVDDTGNLIFHGKTDEDKAKLQAQYDEAVSSK